MEVGAAAVDEIERQLMQLPGEYGLAAPLLAKLRSVAPAFNANGKTVFLGSWGMGPGEIGWMIRRINDQTAFEAYQRSAGVSEDDVNAYDEAWQFELDRATRLAGCNMR